MASLTSSSPPPENPIGVPVGVNEGGAGETTQGKPVTDTEAGESNLEFELVYWTTILSYASFVILLITAFVWGIQKLKVKAKPANI